MPTSLDQPLTLPCGATIKNRLCKAAMTEGLADTLGYPTPELNNLYKVWAEGGAGLLITGNVQVDGDHLERPGNMIIDGESNTTLLKAYAELAKAGTVNDTHLWAQISHAGRQTQVNVNKHPKSASDVALDLPGGQFGKPKPLTKEEIAELVDRYANAAVVVKEAGFTGVQLHGAHGYLISQFLSPKSNHRDDEYGGSLENRARFLLTIVKETRKRVGAEFPIGVKLNSADFQKGGFRFEDSLQVAQWLEEAGIDLLEISGGTYEQPKLVGIEGLEEEEKQEVAESTAKREAYFADFAIAMQEKVKIPLMVTGGFRTKATMESVLDKGVEMIGLGRPLCVWPDIPQQVINGLEQIDDTERDIALFPKWLAFLQKIPMLRIASSFGKMYWYYIQIEAIAKTGKAQDNLTAFAATKQIMAQQKHWLRERREQLK